MYEPMTSELVHQQPLVWVVDSSYTGELHARIGLAERLDYGYELIPLPGNELDIYHKTLENRYRSHAKASPLIIISGTGEETTAEIADLRKLFQGQLFNIYLASILPEQLHPRLAEYDLIASPQLSGNNVVTLLGVPHQLSQENLANARLLYTDYFHTLPKPIIALLVGGNTRYCAGFTPSHARHIAEKVHKINIALGGCVMITNSRRTPSDALTALLKQLSDTRHYFFDWQCIESHFYHALLAHADMFVVTGDSLSMCSEAAFTGKPIFVDLSESATEHYHREIIGRLIDYGAAKLLGDPFESWSYKPIDPTGELVRSINKQLSGHAAV